MIFLNQAKTNSHSIYLVQNGIYLEIGAHDPIVNSNTFNLEVQCNWKGISIEYDTSLKIMGEL